MDRLFVSMDRVRQVGPEAAVMLAVIERGHDWQALSREDWAALLGFNRRAVDGARRVLLAAGLIEYARKDIPARSYYRARSRE